MSFTPPADDFNPQSSSFTDLANAAPPGAAQPQATLIGGVYGGTYGDVTTGGQPEPFFQPDGSMTGPLALRPGATGHTYYEGNEYDILKGMPTEQRARIQEQLVALGLATNVMYGEIDDGSILGMKKVLAMSNRAGTSWQATLSRLSTRPELQEQVDAEAEFDPAPYLRADSASFAQEVKRMFRDRLGREPDQSEMAEFQAELFGWDRARYDAQTAAERAQFEAVNTEGAQAAETIQSVDPAARFAQHFESQYKNELNFIEAREDTAEVNETVDASFGLASQMSRGG